ncbi:MAG: FAD-dependent oxidoreductase [Paracoccus sp. (in: a-proteobacteria)]|uniref:NAD(P)/FAD-dependent oxidoreductase n=1 Tax=Paracoccus sp. TaxID=267 RepID=UPI0039E25540
MLNGSASFHLYDIGARAASRPALAGDISADICIVGAGFTGLWAAWWLRQTCPDRAITIIEAERVGYGASGRNMGWVSGKPIGHRGRLAQGPGGDAAVVDLRRACIEAVTEIPALMREHGVNIDARHGGYLQYALNPAGLARVRATVADRASWGMDENDLRYLTPEELCQHIRIDGALGGLYSPHCTRIQPAKLAVGLAGLLEARGVTIHEQTRALEIAPGRVATDLGTIRAKVILRATEAYSPALPDTRRAIIPMRSSILATEPLSAAEWDSIGWQNAEGLYGAEHASYFATRSEDGRILIAGRGFPYRYGSAVDQDGRIDPPVIRALEQGLARLFPLARPRIAHAWCGVFGTPRDWAPSVRFDPATGIGGAGGYAGQGVAGAYLAGHTLADLVAGRETRWTRLPWTNRRSPDWEPEPLRWLGARVSYHLFRAADRSEQRSQSPETSRLARFAKWLTGRP